MSQDLISKIEYEINQKPLKISITHRVQAFIRAHFDSKLIAWIGSFLFVGQRWISLGLFIRALLELITKENCTRARCIIFTLFGGIQRLQKLARRIRKAENAENR